MQLALAAKYIGASKTVKLNRILLSNIFIISLIDFMKTFEGLNINNIPEIILTNLEVIDVNRLQT
ncbi:unnamed protein product [Debaryomyces tyrocola]|nr:unnamed protein product [Debaryomyces tyrocola]